MASAKIVPLTCHGHSRPVTHLNFSSSMKEDEFYIISACKDNNPMLRDGITGDWIGTFIGHKGAVWQSRLSSDNTYAITGAADFTAKLWDTYTGECLNTFQHTHIVKGVAISPGPEPSFVATGSQDKKLRIFDLGRHSETNSTQSGHTPLTPISSTPSWGSAATTSYEVGSGLNSGAMKSVLWGSDHNMVITATDDKIIRWWDLRTRSPICHVTVEGVLGTCEMNSISTSPFNSKSVLSVAAGTHAYFFDGLTPGLLIKKIDTTQNVASLAFNIDDRKFVFGSKDDTWVHVWSFDEEKELEVHKGHHGPVWTVAYSPNGKLYATGSEDGTVKLWKACKEPYGLWK